MCRWPRCGGIVRGKLCCAGLGQFTVRETWVVWVRVWDVAVSLVMYVAGGGPLGGGGGGGGIVGTPPHEVESIAKRNTKKVWRGPRAERGRRKFQSRDKT